MRKGNAIATYPLIIFMCVLFIIIIGVFFINSIIPFIWYQKLNTVTQKYMFVIEKFGYLTDLEKQNFINELEEKGFDKNNIEIIAPEERKTYGELIELKVNYKYIYNKINYYQRMFSKEANYINMEIKKSSFSKI